MIRRAHHAWLTCAALSLLALLACAVAAAHAAAAQAAASDATPAARPPADSITARAERYLSVRTEMGGFSGAVLIARAGHIVYRQGYGYADLARRVPFTPETAHEVASISKMFTAMAALKLRDQGRLHLEDTIDRYLTDCPDAWKTITVQQLMRHTSGISDYEEQLEVGSPAYMAFMEQPGATDTIVARARTQPLDFAPGEKFKYSNTGYIVLSRVVERAAGEPFAAFVTRTLLRPAGMKHSGVFDGHTVPKGLADGYTYGDLGWAKMLAGAPLTDGHLTVVPHLPLTPPAGDAGAYSSVDDLYRWSIVMDGGTLVPATEAAEVLTPGLGNYGYGWFIERGFDRRRLRHNGILPGHVSDLIKFPDDSITIVLVSNLDRTRLDRVARDITAITLGTSYDMPVRGTLASLSAEEYTRLEGEFAMADGTHLTVKKDGDLLAAALAGRYTAGLIPLSQTEFYMPLGDGRATFSLGPDGRATRVNMRYGGDDHIAERVTP